MISPNIICNVFRDINEVLKKENVAMVDNRIDAIAKGLSLLANMIKDSHQHPYFQVEDFKKTRHGSMMITFLNAAVEEPSFEYMSKNTYDKINQLANNRLGKLLSLNDLMSQSQCGLPPDIMNEVDSYLLDEMLINSMRKEFTEKQTPRLTQIAERYRNSSGQTLDQYYYLNDFSIPVSEHAAFSGDYMPKVLKELNHQLQTGLKPNNKVVFFLASWVWQSSYRHHDMSLIEKCIENGWTPNAEWLCNIIEGCQRSYNYMLSIESMLPREPVWRECVTSTFLYALFTSQDPTYSSLLALIPLNSTHINALAQKRCLDQQNAALAKDIIDGSFSVSSFQFSNETLTQYPLTQHIIDKCIDDASNSAQSPRNKRHRSQ